VPAAADGAARIETSPTAIQTATFAKLGDLVRCLGRQAARQLFEEQVKAIAGRAGALPCTADVAPKRCVPAGRKRARGTASAGSPLTPTPSPEKIQ
jgi:hypothetical protein